MAASKKKKAGSWIANIAILLVFLIGAGIFLYPTVSDLWNRYRNQRLIAEYGETIERLSDKDYTQVWEEARAYNEQHKVNIISDAFEDEEDYVLSHPYDTLLDPSGNGIMGYLEIPSIDVELAIYHGVGKTALEQGCGHLEGTSLPIGGAGTHAVLSAHRGLPSAKLFTDLDQMKEGDLFYITVLGEKLAYEVDQILTVLPDEVDGLAIEEGEDYVTLLTCTPYGVNTHRLLVRGRRTEYTQPEVKRSFRESILMEDSINRRLLIIGSAVFLVMVFILWCIFRKKKKR